MGDVAEGGGWVARAARIVAEDGTDSMAAAFLNVAGAFEAAGGGDLEGAARIAGECVEAARRHGSAQYAALSLHQQGLFLLAAGRTDAGLACLDEAMLGVASGECSAMVEGIIYCGVIEGCWSIYELTRAQQWTAAMSRWVAAQPDLGNFTGECKVRRAELEQFNGRWPEALDELDAVGSAEPDAWAVGRAASVRGNLDRLLGRFDSAEEQFALASHLGEDPQPGLALLRLARGSVQAAAAMVRRSLAETHQTGRRIQVLAAATEILLAVGEPEAAEADGRRARELAAVNRSPVVVALGQHAAGLGPPRPRRSGGGAARCCVRRSAPGSGRGRRTRRPAPGSCSPTRAARWTTASPPTARWTRRGRSSRTSARSRTWPGSR